MSNTVYILNGPNLNLLGTRQPELYGTETLLDVKKQCQNFAAKHNWSLFFSQTNSEHQLIDWIQEAQRQASAIIINPAAYSHTSIAILDALNMFEGLVVEVHISDIYKREKFRQFSYVSNRANKIIVGQGIKGYLLAMEVVVEHYGIK